MRRYHKLACVTLVLVVTGCVNVNNDGDKNKTLTNINLGAQIVTPNTFDQNINNKKANFYDEYLDLYSYTLLSHSTLEYFLKKDPTIFETNSTENEDVLRNRHLIKNTFEHHFQDNMKKVENGFLFPLVNEVIACEKNNFCVVDEKDKESVCKYAYMHIYDLSLFNLISRFDFIKSFLVINDTVRRRKVNSIYRFAVYDCSSLIFYNYDPVKLRSLVDNLPEEFPQSSTIDYRSILKFYQMWVRYDESSSEKLFFNLQFQNLNFDDFWSIVQSTYSEYKAEYKKGSPTI